MGRAVVYAQQRGTENGERGTGNGEQGKGKGKGKVLDAVYVIGTIIFFAAMIAYGRACHSLGQDDEAEGRRP